MKVISLFEKWQMQHEHFISEKDAQTELWILLLSVREMHWKYKRTMGEEVTGNLVEEFVSSHRHVNCANPQCRNIHGKNHNIARRILAERPDLAQQLFSCRTFTLGDSIKMKNVFDTTDAPPPNKTHVTDISEMKRPLSFGCHLTYEQMVRIADCANTSHLFCVQEVSVEDVQSLLKCEQGFQITVNNIRNVTVMLDTMVEQKLIDWNWKAAMTSGKHLLSKTRKPISASSLSSALSEVRKRPTAMSKNIARTIRGIAALEEDPTVKETKETRNLGNEEIRN